MKRTDHASRLDKFFDDAAGPPIDVSATVNRAGIAIDHLIDNVGRRIEWHEAEHGRLTRTAMAKGDPPPVPVSLMGELEVIGRVVSALQDLRSAFNTGDPNAGANEIVRIIELARKDFFDVKEGSPKRGKDKVSPEAGEGEAGVNPRQITAQAGTDGPSNGVHRIINHGLVRRGSG